MAELTGAQLQRTCGPLYPSFALESVSALFLFAFFAYLSILISSRQQLKAPARSIGRFLWSNFSGWCDDTCRVLSRWSEMDTMPIAGRLRYCRRLNSTICRFSAAVALLSVTRWLHFNNINGFRYLGYAFTCPLMQAELVLLIAPIVPCYKTVTKFTALITWAMLMTGYIASQFEGPLWLMDGADLTTLTLTTKGWITAPSCVTLFFLSFVQIPVLGLMYCCNGGGATGELPPGYLKLLFLTSVTWLGFPCWWFLSFEGAGYIQDTKLNGLGFVLLNMTSKGSFTMQMLAMVRQWKCDFGPQQTQPPVQAVLSGEEATKPLSPRSQKTEKSAEWMIDSLKSWDLGAVGTLDRVPEFAPGVQGQPEPVSEKEAVLLDTSYLSDEVLVAELVKRLNLSTEVIIEGEPLDAQEVFTKSLDDEIRQACALFAKDEDKDDDDSDDDSSLLDVSSDRAPACRTPR